MSSIVASVYPKDHTRSSTKFEPGRCWKWCTQAINLSVPSGPPTPRPSGNTSPPVNDGLGVLAPYIGGTLEMSVIMVEALVQNSYSLNTAFIFQDHHIL
jgi:hypothetical protein